MIAVILARGGSKGVPGKNIRYLGNKPLIAYPIIAALNTRHIDKIYVSTEDRQIAGAAKKYGAYAIKRPISLSKDNTIELPVFRHFIKKANIKD